MKNKFRIVTVSNQDCDVKKATQQSYSCTYEYKGKIRLITDGGLYKEINSFDANPPRPLLLNFTKQAMFHEFEYETDTNLQNDSDRNLQRVKELFWMNNPICLDNGKSHANLKVGDQYNMIDFSQKTTNSVNRFQDIMRAANKLMSMTHTERVDVAYYYGVSPANKSEQELLIELSNVESDENGNTKGFCLKPTNLDGFLKIWVDGKSDDTKTMVIIKKAIAYDIITNRSTDGRNNYYLNDTFLGTDEIGILDWGRKSEREFAEHIVRVVNERDKAATAKKEKQPDAKTVDLNKLVELRGVAKRLKEEGFIGDTVPYQSMGFDKLTAIVKEATEKKNAITV